MQLIGLLRQLGDLDGARKARNSMSEVFPLTEGRGRRQKGGGREGHGEAWEEREAKKAEGGYG